jgi:glycosyltransferase involved in cell wall biosynthesis
MTAPGREPGRVAILLATRDGARFLDEQMLSLDAQDWPAVDVVGSDDGSSDATPDRLAHWAGRWRKGRFAVRSGPGRGFAANFQAMLCDLPADADFIAFCDQDDVWLPRKLATATSVLASHGGRPAMFCGRTLLIDEAGHEIGRSPLFSRPPSFRNALVQNIGGGNTIVLNRAAAQLACEGARRTGFVSHDWFCYMLVTGAGGTVHYEADPLVRYRQHGRNAVGANAGWRARMDRLGHAWRGRFVDWNERNLLAMEACRSLLTPDNQRILDTFAASRRGGVASRIAGLARSGVYRQTLGGQLSLYAAAMLNKF